MAFLFLFGFLHAGDFSHQGGVKFFDGGCVDFVFVEFFGLVKGGVDIFVIKVLEFLFIGLSFEFVFGVSLVVAELGSLGEGTTGGLYVLLFNLLNGGMVNGLVVKAEVFF